MELLRKIDEGAARGRSGWRLVLGRCGSRVRETHFVKYDIAGYIQPTRNGIQTTVSLVRCTIAQEDTAGGSEREFVGLVGTKERIAGASEGA